MNLDAFEKGWGMFLPRLGHRLKIQHLAKRNPVRLDDILAVAQVHLAFRLFYEDVVDGGGEHGVKKYKKRPVLPERFSMFSSQI